MSYLQKKIEGFMIFIGVKIQIIVISCSIRCSILIHSFIYLHIIGLCAP